MLNTAEPHFPTTLETNQNWSWKRGDCCWAVCQMPLNFAELGTQFCCYTYCQVFYFFMRINICWLVAVLYSTVQTIMWYLSLPQLWSVLWIIMLLTLKNSRPFRTELFIQWQSQQIRYDCRHGIYNDMPCCLQILDLQWQQAKLQWWQAMLSTHRSADCCSVGD